jgi:sortase A
MMDEMQRRRHTATGWLALGVAGMALLTACSGDNEPMVEAAATSTSTSSTTEATTTTQTPTTTTTTTTMPPTTTSTTTSTTSTTTTTTTTTLGPLTTTAPQLSEAVPTTRAPASAAPVAPPSDSYAREPVIELGRIQIPKLGVDMTMYEGIRLTTLDYGPGHWPGSAMPGQAGNVVVGGHRTSKHRVFRNVDQLVPGDHIVFTDSSGTHTYAVSKVQIVQPTDVWIINPTPTPTATLFACHPPGSTAQRIVVFADLVS